MFKIARFLVQNKIGAIAVVGIGAFLMMPSGEEEEPTSSSPWSKQTQQVATASTEESSFVSDMVGTAVDEAGAYLDEAGINPLSEAEESVGRFEDTAGAMSDANK